MNKRPNGPVNALLISGPNMSTKNKFCQIWHGCKTGQGQLRVIIYIHFVELEYIMVHAKFQSWGIIIFSQNFETHSILS